MSSDTQTKRCIDCQAIWPLVEYNRSARSPDGCAPFCKSCAAIRRARYHETNGFRWRAERVAKNHSLTICQLTAMRIAQDDKCAICGRPSDRGPLVVDHDHDCCPGKSSCGKCVRGLLCNGCNTALGLMKDSIPRLLSAVDYLERGGSWQSAKERSRIATATAGIEIQGIQPESGRALPAF